MSKQHKIHTVLDMLKLSPDEFTRMLPDLAEWYRFCRIVAAEGNAIGAKATGFTWVDDGRTGEVFSVVAKVGSETVEVRGEAYVEPKA